MTRVPETTMSTERNPASATVKIDSALLLKAKQFCAMKAIKVADYIDQLLRRPIERDHAKAMREIADEHHGHEEEGD